MGDSAIGYVDKVKATSTIRREIRRLMKMVDDESLSMDTRQEAYEAYHALRWVIGDLDTRPSQLIALAAEATR